jgi:hypothetical protein
MKEMDPIFAPWAIKPASWHRANCNIIAIKFRQWQATRKKEGTLDEGVSWIEEKFNRKEELENAKIEAAKFVEENLEAIEKKQAQREGRQDKPTGSGVCPNVESTGGTGTGEGIQVPSNPAVEVRLCSRCDDGGNRTGGGCLDTGTAHQPQRVHQGLREVQCSDTLRVDHLSNPTGSTQP